MKKRGHAWVATCYDSVGAYSELHVGLRYVQNANIVYFNHYQNTKSVNSRTDI